MASLPGSEKIDGFPEIRIKRVDRASSPYREEIRFVEINDEPDEGIDTNVATDTIPSSELVTFEKARKDLQTVIESHLHRIESLTSELNR
jgi:hypothetical protein